MRWSAVTLALIATASPLLAQRNDCKPTSTPRQLPAADALVDSAGILTELAAFEAPQGMLFSLVYLGYDSLPLVRPLYETDPNAARIVAGLLRPQPRSSTWGIRVRVAQAPAPMLWLERAVYCPPVWIQEGDSRRVMTARVQPGDRVTNSPGRIGRIELEMLVSTRGLPTRVRVIQSTGYRDVDEQIVSDWRRARFEPALLDGLPVEAVYRNGGKSPRL